MPRVLITRVWGIFLPSSFNLSLPVGRERVRTEDTFHLDKCNIAIFILHWHILSVLCSDNSPTYSMLSEVDGVQSLARVWLNRQLAIDIQAAGIEFVTSVLWEEEELCNQGATMPPDR